MFTKLLELNRIIVKLLRFDEVRLKAGHTPMLGFQAQFVTNFRIPAFVDVGEDGVKGIRPDGGCNTRLKE